MMVIINVSALWYLEINFRIAEYDPCLESEMGIGGYRIFKNAHAPRVGVLFNIFV